MTVKLSELHDLPRLSLDEAADFDGAAPALIIQTDGFAPDDALELLQALTATVKLPLIFSGTNAEVLRLLARAYAGVAGIEGHTELASACGAVAL